MEFRSLDRAHLVLVILFSTVIAVGATGELWFDEIWSLGFALSSSSPLEILTRHHHDNNHPLNTLRSAYQHSKQAHQGQLNSSSAGS